MLVKLVFCKKQCIVYDVVTSKWHAQRSAPIAQLDRASGYGPEGLGFKSLWVYHFFYSFFRGRVRLQIFEKANFQRVGFFFFTSRNLPVADNRTHQTCPAGFLETSFYTI